MRGLIIVCALLFVGIIGTVQEYKAQESSSSPSASQPSGSGEGSALNKPDQPIESGSKENERQGGNGDYLTRSEKYTLWTNLALLIIVVLQVWIALRQTKIADQQREIMQKQIEMSEAIERGYIGIGDMQITNLAAGHRPTVIIKWINGGRTPVQNFRANPTLVFGKEPTTKSLGRIDDDVSPISTTFFPVGAEREVRYEQTDPVSEANYNAFHNGSVNIYIVGNFIYRDMNGQTRSGGISAMHDMFDEFVYETYEHTGAEQSQKLVKPA